MDITVFLGAPGSGKGTQAKRLTQSHHFRHFSTGDMLRAALHAGNSVGIKAKQFIERGELVADDVMIELIENALRELPSAGKIILDGFPRTVPQAQALDHNPKTVVDRAVYFMMPEKVLINRLTGRRICEKCGESFHVLFVPPRVLGKCDKCGGALMQRPDDSEGVVQRRLEIFEQQNALLLDYYGKVGKLRELNADRPVEALQNELLGILE